MALAMPRAKASSAMGTIHSGLSLSAWSGVRALSEMMRYRPKPVSATATAAAIVPWWHPSAVPAAMGTRSLRAGYRAGVKLPMGGVVGEW